MSSQLPGVLHPLSSVLDHYGYLALVGVVAVEGVGVPAPGQIILIAAGVYAASGHLNLAAVLILALLAAVIGDNFGYAIGYYGGRPLVRRFGRYVLLTEGRVAATERFFHGRGNMVVLIGRFVDGLRQAIGIVAGLAEMQWRRFLTYNVVGAVAWVGLWVLVGYLAQTHIPVIYAKFVQYQTYLLIAVAVVLIGLLTRWLYRRRQESSAG
ncbi:alkaline phosphatase [Mycobacterium sp. 852002-51163_SCH5372311]|uniref:DedA family protein n=1 Tax=Mycobacterium sp. 852002-51163_SCH5372311 TaxID=1834097 RepID=UPI0007FE9DEF|nr:DedA family protein [Mycobacterium sp. 852002-51163_SCH5372311]OBF92958.1 alkaline phosphatase [Mycobacterium sp. 852002-51163_SCH5372311]